MTQFSSYSVCRATGWPADHTSHRQNPSTDDQSLDSRNLESHKVECDFRVNKQGWDDEQEKVLFRSACFPIDSTRDRIFDRKFWTCLIFLRFQITAATIVSQSHREGKIRANTPHITGKSDKTIDRTIRPSSLCYLCLGGMWLDFDQIILVIILTRYSPGIVNELILIYLKHLCYVQKKHLILAEWETYTH